MTPTATASAVGLSPVRETPNPVGASAITGTAEYVVPVDPMDELQCDSCQ